MSKLSHLDDEGRASMVDVSAKGETLREASAEAIIVLSPEAFEQAVSGQAKKGDVLGTARLAGIMAAKKTSELIPLCHPLALTHAAVEFEALAVRHAFRIVASARTAGQTGVEMEALTAAAIAALTIYDMVKAVDKGACIESIRLLTKSGGKSGSYVADPKESKPAPVPEPAKSQQRKASPQILNHETAAPRQKASSGEREALRNFMQERRLRPTEWAKAAGIPVNELYGYLSGRSRVLPPDAAGKLAKAAKSPVGAMFGRKGEK